MAFGIRDVALLATLIGTIEGLDMGFLDNLFESDREIESSSQLQAYAPARKGLDYGIEQLAEWMQTPQRFFPGQTYADFMPAQLQGIEALKAGAGGMGAMLPQMAAGYGVAMGGPQSVLDMGLQDVASNPYLAGIADVMEQRSQERMLEDVLPQMTAGAVGGGGLGGSRLAVGAQQAERDRQRALDEALAGLYGDAWSQGLGAETSRYNQAQAGMLSALGMTPALMGAYTAPAAPMLQAGGLEQAQEQRGINEAMRRHQFAQMEPFQRATMGLGALSPLAAQFGEQRGQTTEQFTPSTFSNIGNIASLGFGLAGGIGDQFGGMGGFGGGMAPETTGGLDPYGFGWNYGAGQQWTAPPTSYQGMWPSMWGS